MEIEHKLCNGMATDATAYIGERTRIDKIQSGLARFTKRSADSDSTGEKVNLNTKNVRNIKYFCFTGYTLE